MIPLDVTREELEERKRRADAFERKWNFRSEALFWLTQALTLGAIPLWYVSPWLMWSSLAFSMIARNAWRWAHAVLVAGVENWTNELRDFVERSELRMLATVGGSVATWVAGEIWRAALRRRWAAFDRGRRDR